MCFFESYIDCVSSVWLQIPFKKLGTGVFRGGQINTKYLLGRYLDVFGALGLSFLVFSQFPCLLLVFAQRQGMVLIGTVLFAVTSWRQLCKGVYAGPGPEDGVEGCGGGGVFFFVLR